MSCPFHFHISPSNLLGALPLSVPTDPNPPRGPQEDPVIPFDSPESDDDADPVGQLSWPRPDKTTDSSTL